MRRVFLALLLSIAAVFTAQAQKYALIYME